MPDSRNSLPKRDVVMRSSTPSRKSLKPQKRERPVSSEGLGSGESRRGSIFSIGELSEVVESKS